MDDKDSTQEGGSLVDVRLQRGEKLYTHDRGKALEEIRRMPQLDDEASRDWPRRGRAFRRVALFGGLLGLMLLSPMFLLLGTDVKIAQDLASVPRAEPVAEESPLHSPLHSPPLDHGIAAMIKAQLAPGDVPDSFPYTVHVSSFRRATRAAAQVMVLREQGETAFAAYVEIPGMGGWFRVFCGNHPTREDAEKGRERLTMLGIKETSRAKKSVALAVEGPLPLMEALALESRLHAKGFFAYAMPRPLPDGRVQVLLGAFQAESRAKAMLARLTEAGFQAKAVKR